MVTRSLGKRSLAFHPYSRSAKVSGALKIKRSKSWPFISREKKGMPEVGHSRQKYVGFILSIVQFSSKSDTDKVKCTRKSIFTSYFLSWVQSHTFRRLSLGEWPQRESASLLLKKKEISSHIRPVNQKETSQIAFEARERDGEILRPRSHRPAFSLKTCKYSELPCSPSLFAVFVTTAPSELLWNYLKEWCNFLNSCFI